MQTYTSKAFLSLPKFCCCCCNKILTKTNLGRKGFIWRIVCSTLLREAVEETQVLKTRTVGNLHLRTYSKPHPQKTCPVMAPLLWLLKTMPTGCLRANPYTHSMVSSTFFPPRITQGCLLIKPGFFIQPHLTYCIIGETQYWVMESIQELRQNSSRNTLTS